jgi:hypothetical protein
MLGRGCPICNSSQGWQNIIIKETGGIRMIVYDLICSAGHRFEGWFDGPAEYDHQHQANEIACPACGSSSIRKLPTAARLVGNAAERIEDFKCASETVLQRLHGVVQRHYEDVGGAFPEEARKMHYGETDERRIRGTATPKEARELAEEGIAVLPIPSVTLNKRRLN